MFILYWIVHKDKSERRIWTDDADEAHGIEKGLIRDDDVDHYERIELETGEGAN